MTALADAQGGTVKPATLAAFVDRWIYVFTAVLFLAVVLAGFIPDSLTKIEAVQTGRRPPFPPILHAHAVLMGAWIMLLLAQTTLMATDRPALHKKLGLLAFVLGPALVIVGFILVPTMRLQGLEAILHASPDAAANLKAGFYRTLNIMLIQIRIGLLFALLIGVGLWARRHDSSLHKRLMILGTAAPLPAALDRIAWLPTSLPHGPLTTELYPLAVLAPMFAWDLYRLGRVHGAYLVYLGVSLLLAIPTHLLWNTPWWRGVALRILGISGI
ncbi:MAG TPA: hypothetical protein VG841_06250 [Caulobacterales bacterium]|nr:hypothetical protein [Caulobacterales bacterium]